jgi:DNA-binding winged helix-turn-helix (wHTH) protein
MAERISVGDWTFTPADGSLSRDGQKHRLEHRAAKLLEALCRRAGTPVSAAELVDSVWGGRSLSQNSVAVVVADLRRALDDDSRAPRYIETLPKRGYRLIAEVQFEGAAVPSAPATERPGLRRPLIGAALALILAALTWASYSTSKAGDAFTVAVGAFPNETGSARYAALVPAYAELVATELGRHPGLQLVRGEAGADARVRGTIILWDGHPAVALFAEEPEGGAAIWTGMASAPPGQLPGAVRQELDEFAAQVSPEGSAAR